MVKLSEDKLLELESICEDVDGVASLLSAVSDNDNDSVNITAIRTIGYLACDARDQLLMFIHNLQTFNGNGSEIDAIHRYKTTQLLVIDDMGKEPPTEWAVSTIYNIINGRYEACLPTIVTSNYSENALIARMTPKETKDPMTAQTILDRISEMCGAIVLTGGSWRRKE